MNVKRVKLNDLLEGQKFLVNEGDDEGQMQTVAEEPAGVRHYDSCGAEYVRCLNEVGESYMALSDTRVWIEDDTSHEYPCLTEEDSAKLSMLSAWYNERVDHKFKLLSRNQPVPDDLDFQIETILKQIDELNRFSDTMLSLGRTLISAKAVNLWGFTLDAFQRLNIEQRHEMADSIDKAEAAIDRINQMLSEV